MKQNLFEEVGRMHQMINEQNNMFNTVVKIKPMAFAIKHKDEFIDYFNRIAAVINRDDVCEEGNMAAIAQQSVNSLKVLIKNISDSEKITDKQLIDFVLGQLTSGFAKTLIDIAIKSIPSFNVVPKEILDAVKKYLLSTYGEQGTKLVAAIDGMVAKLKQPVQPRCGGSYDGELPSLDSNYGELRQTTPQPIQSKGPTQLPTNQAKPKLNTQSALKQQMSNQQTAEKNKPLQNAANKVKDVASNIANKVRDKIKNRGGQGPANT
jgi:hypothetical protein